MNSELVLWVDEEHVSTRKVVDVASGEVRDDRVSARELCRSLGIHYQAMTSAIKELVLYERKTKADGQPVLVRIADLGPYVLARVVDGTVQNGFGVHDIPKPTRLSADTLRNLAGIFGGLDRQKE